MEMIFCLALAHALSSLGGAVHVDPAGSDVAPGTAAAPVASLQAALAICAKARHHTGAACSIFATGHIAAVNETVTIPVAVQSGLVLDRWPGRPIPTFSGGVAAPPAACKVGRLSQHPLDTAIIAPPLCCLVATAVAAAFAKPTAIPAHSPCVPPYRHHKFRPTTAAVCQRDMERCASGWVAGRRGDWKKKREKKRGKKKRKRKKEEAACARSW